MSEKNVGGHNGAQWTKAASAPQKQQPHNAAHLYDGIPPGLVVTPTTNLYGGAVHHPDNIISYATARFQPPPIHNVVANHAVHQHATPHPLPPSHAPATVLSTVGANVPAAPSGFVPPSFPPVAAATSVLTPNPFAAAASGGASTAGAAFSWQDLHNHLNPQQQFELSKIMNAVSSVTAAASMASASTSAAGGGGMVASPTVNIAAPIGPAPPIQSTPAAAAATSAVTTGGISTAIAESVLSAIGTTASPMTANAGNVAPIHGRLMGIGVKVPPDEDKLRRLQHAVESGISDHAKQQILQLLDRISTLKPVEKLMLYLRLPGEAPETDPLRHPQNPLGTRSEINHTINWVRSHLEHDPQVSIPKQDVYNDYLAYCERLDIKPLSTADFGKVMKQVFPGIRPRRLGTRGHSRYCYAAMRKTTKLTAPQLPPLGSAAVPGTSAAGSGSDFSDPPLASHEGDTESWETIKTWAESLLNVKVDNAKDLATRIKSTSSGIANNAATGNAGARPNVAQKKYTQREPKEKRFLADMGPLKKRRKKKRKGSSSSESSCSQSQTQSLTPAPAQVIINNNNNNSNSSSNNNNISKGLSPSTAAFALHNTSSMGAPSEEDQKSIKMIEVKQEFLESPNFQHVQHLPPPIMQAASMAENYLHQQQQQQQILPMNLATEQRSVLARAPPAVGSAFGTVALSTQSQAQLQQRVPFGAVKNLTPKIIELSATAAASTSNAPPSAEQLPIKEEFIDEYNPTNIFCKKVRKAQQTKGFWANSPTPSPHGPTTTATSSVAAEAALIVVSAATPPSTSAAFSGGAAAVASPVSNFLMGPPAQIGTSTSPSASALLEAGSTIAASPKVASRNMIILRAKRAAAAAVAANEAAGGDINVDKDADLPENLGLPRERVISICNMDKHELDDYFLPGEEENSQDQETELLQYFQTGDAEEKLNSSDATKHRNPTSKTTPQTPHSAAASTTSHENSHHAMEKGFSVDSTATGGCVSAHSRMAAVPVTTAAGVATITAARPAATPAVGSASASLTLMSQKHQQQQPQTYNHNNNSNKRKINIPASGDMMPSAARKNCIFLPISPNINSGSTTGNANAANAGLFASPGQTRLRPKPSLLMSKQQSLDSDSTSDPMIGASRRRRSYVSFMPSSTSASAPPSPSVLQQQQHLYGSGPQPFLSHGWQLNSAQTANGGTTNYSDAAALLNDHDSLDFDLFNAEANAGNSAYAPLTLDANSNAPDDCHLTPLTETQRSQSVPLSQLQRTHSPAFGRGFHPAATSHYSACPSMVPTPVQREFTEASIFSENSNSQQSVGGHNPALGVVAKLGDSTGGTLATSANSTVAAMLDAVDVSEILSSPDFVAKFSSIAQANTITTTCSSAGSSSGYSSGACTSFGSAVAGGKAALSGCGIASRSVPSTPLPHHQQQNPFSSFYDRRRANDEMHLSPTAGSGAGNAITAFTNSAFKYGGCASSGNSIATRSAYDISKSMPTTPITTPSFRYSPTEFNRDFLINIESIGNDNLIGGNTGTNAVSDFLDVAELNTNNSLIDEDAISAAADSF